MALFSRNYEPGGEYHIRIDDQVFEQAQYIIKNDKEYYNHYKEWAEKIDCAKYEAHDFPVTEILGVFRISYQLQEERCGVPQELQSGYVQIGRKEKVEYEKFVKRYQERIEAKERKKGEKYAQKGLGGKLLSDAAGLAFKGVARVASGKSEDVRWFEKEIANYTCGNSQKAKDFILQYAIEFGGTDDGVLDVSACILHNFWQAEFVRYNRQFVPRAIVSMSGFDKSTSPTAPSNTVDDEPILDQASTMETFFCTVPRCGRQIPSDSVFCGYCGTKVAN
jgi:hypothetical protein